MARIHGRALHAILGPSDVDASRSTVCAGDVRRRCYAYCDSRNAGGPLYSQHWSALDNPGPRCAAFAGRPRVVGKKARVGRDGNSAAGWKVRRVRVRALVLFGSRVVYMHQLSDLRVPVGSRVFSAPTAQLSSHWHATPHVLAPLRPRCVNLVSPSFKPRPLT